VRIVEPLGPDEIRASFVNCTRGEAKGVTLPARPEEIPWDRREFLGRRDPKAPGREGNTLGTYACGNLGCCQYVRGELKSDVPQPFETLTLDERLARLEEKVHKFVARVLESR
jgi:hypothetical protein